MNRSRFVYMQYAAVCLFMVGSMVQGAGAEEIRKRPAADDSLRLSPRGAAFRSALIPGWGQWYNGSRWKAAGFLAAEGLFLGFALDRDRQFDATGDQRYKAERNTYQWWLGFSIAFSVVDAYIDAFLDRFAEDLEITMTPDPRSGGWLLGVQLAFH